MTYQPCWYKAVSLSCAVHLVFILLLVMVMGQLDRPLALPERYLTVELTEIAGCTYADSVPAPAAVSPVSPQLDQPQPSAARPAADPAAAPAPAAGAEIAAVTATAGTAGSGEGPAPQTAAAVAGPAAPAARTAGGRELDSIINGFLSQIEKYKEYPYIARRRGQEGTVTVAVRLSAAGELAGAQVVRSSGIAALDEAALTLVRKVCPFAHNAGRSIAMNIPIAYQIE
ncbi:energy transducer TonB [Sporomusa termitida]|uniref:TonB C-terminal domain-containing protein n=1 Tax=Sporomusa termitida TaxID=2377 RepID=A0A517DNP0_9FIRM|nr:energy transducer TonB [Sporomusa termitida]QDR78983.1 hypothetical protein SPTER_02340 [Sporomusa termitida]